MVGGGIIMTCLREKEFGVRTKVGSGIRAELLGLIKTRSEQTGVSMTRIIEDALVLYMCFIYIDGDDFDVAQELNDLPMGDACNEAAHRLSQWLASDD
jgi:hypothetical protein